MTSTPPFRLSLHRSPQPLEGESLELFYRLTGPEARSARLEAELVRRGSEEEDESVRFLLARYSDANPREEDGGVASLARFIHREMARADEEGVVWTPVLDALAAGTGWAFLTLNSHAVRRSGQPEVPAPQQRLRQLAPWVAAQRDPEALEPLFRFEYPGVRAVIAGHASPLTEEQEKRLLEFSYSLISNPRLSAEAAGRLAQAALDEWRELTVIENSAAPPEYPRKAYVPRQWESRVSQRIELLAAFASRGRLDEAHRQQIFHFMPGVERADVEPLRILALDPHCSPEMLREVVESRLPDPSRIPETSALLGHLLLHPRLEEEVRERLIRERGVEGALWLLQRMEDDRPAVPRQMLMRLLDAHPQHPALAAAVARSSEADAEVWRRCLGLHPRLAPVQRAVAEQEEALQDEEVMAALMKSRSPAVIEQLLSRVRGDDFARLFRRLHSGEPSAAYRWLRGHSLPEGTRLPSALVASLLTTERAEDRLAVIAALPSLASSPEIPDSRVRRA